MKFKSFIMPRRVQFDEAELSDTYGRFVIEPLERGFGTTIGNSLRRVLLSSIQGAAITSVKIEGVLQEISSLPNVYEDVTDIILNLKEIVFNLHKPQPVRLYLNVSGKDEVVASDFEANADVDILTPDVKIATLEKDGSLSMEVTVEMGRGYVPAETRKDELPLHTIAVDSVFTPIRRVKYHVENTRVEDITDYDRLVLEIWTDGTVRPDEALSHAGRILKDHLTIFITLDDEEPTSVDSPEEHEIPINPNLMKSIDELELSVRSYNCLKAAHIQTVCDLVTRNEPEMLKYRNFGKKSLTEIRELLDNMGLRLGMNSEDPQIKAVADRLAAERAAAGDVEEDFEPSDYENSGEEE